MTKRQFALLFVWHHDNQFVCNTDEYPFWHNIEYHARRYKCIVLYCVESDGSLQLPVCKNIKLINYKKAYPHYYGNCVDSIVTRAGKIDYMKVTAMLNPHLLDVAYNYLLLMDMDCVVQSVQWKQLSTDTYCFEPFYDSQIKWLYSPKSGQQNFDSYLENYATLIRVKQVQQHRKELILHCVDFLTMKANDNFMVFKNYINMIIKVYLQFYNYTFPINFEDNTMKPCVNLTFRRGGSWKTQLPPVCNYVYKSKNMPKFNE